MFSKLCDPRHMSRRSTAAGGEHGDPRGTLVSLGNPINYILLLGGGDTEIVLAFIMMV
jgi:hypothetical protein